MRYLLVTQGEDSNRPAKLAGNTFIRRSEFLSPEARSPSPRGGSKGKILLWDSSPRTEPETTHREAPESPAEGPLAKPQTWAFRKGQCPETPRKNNCYGSQDNRETEQLSQIEAEGIPLLWGTLTGDQQHPCKVRPQITAEFWATPLPCFWKVYVVT